MASSFIEPTKWPAGFNPNDKTAILQVCRVDERTPTDASVGQHAHPTGQFAAALSGLVGLEIGRKRIAMPPGSCIWVPPGMLHEGFLGTGAVSLYCLINADWAKLLPTTPCRLQLRPLALELMRHFTDAPPCFQLKSHEGRLAEVLYEELLLAPKLPLVFAPMPSHAGLRRIAEALAETPSISVPASEWAASLGMSERTLGRLSLQETGLSFGAWRQRLVMLAAADLLLQGKTSEETAFRLGYGSGSAFSAAFRRLFGVTPGAFRLGKTASAGLCGASGAD